MAAKKKLSVTEIARSLGRRMRGRAMDAAARREKYFNAAATVPAALASSNPRWRVHRFAFVMRLRGFGWGGERSGVWAVSPLSIRLRMYHAPMTQRLAPARPCWQFELLHLQGSRTTATGALREVYRRMRSVPDGDLLCILHEDCSLAAVDSDASVRALSATCARNALAELEAGIPKGLDRVRYTKDDHGKGGVFDVRPGSKLYVPPTRRSTR